jgi:hypothetical protein
MIHKKSQFIEFTALGDNIPDVLYTSPVVRETKKEGLKISNQRNSSVEFDEYYYDNIKKGAMNDWWNFVFLSDIEKNDMHYSCDYYTIRLIKSKETISSPHLNRVSFKSNEQSELIYSQKERR